MTKSKLQGAVFDAQEALKRGGLSTTQRGEYRSLIRSAEALSALSKEIARGIKKSKLDKPPRAPIEAIDEWNDRISEVAGMVRPGGTILGVDDIGGDFQQEIIGVLTGENADGLLGIKTEYAKLDEMTGGLSGGDLVILAGRPGAGKTAFGLNIAHNIAKQEDTGVLCFSLEMTGKQLFMRMVSHYGVNMHNLRLGKKLDGETIVNLERGIREVRALPVEIDENGMTNIKEMEAKARRIQSQFRKNGVKLGLIFVDYLQLMSGTGEKQNENRVQEITQISRSLKALAKELDVPILAASQLNREVETRTTATKKTPIPKLSDLRESGSIEQDADIVLFLSMENNEDKEQGKRVYPVQLTIAKQRNGPVGKIMLTFNTNYSRFTEQAHLQSGERF